MTVTDSEAQKQAQLERVTRSPRYRALVRRRSRLSWQLTALMLAIYFGYILLIAFRPDVLARSIAGGASTLGIPVGIGVIISGIVLTALYVRRANGEFDRETAVILDETGIGSDRA